jgi:hypothetical protein
MTGWITDEMIEEHIDSLIKGAKRAEADPVLLELVNNVYAPFIKSISVHMRRTWNDPEDSIKPVLDAVVDMITLMIVHTSNYIAPHDQLESRLNFINMFFVHMADRMQDMLLEMYPAEEFEKLVFGSILKHPGEKTH